VAPVTASERVAESQRCFLSHSANETFALGARLGQLLAPGDFIGLIGDLGTGKTEFVRGVAQGAGVSAAEVSSPTFAIISAYRGRIPIYHADFFRVRDYDETYATGFTDLLESDGAVLVEWLNRVPCAAPRELILLSFEDLGGEERRILAYAYGIRYQHRLQTWIPEAGSSKL
jgi:tRNA threonylcarbamoyladenosine biosynthesis protein TsaE